MKKYSILFMTSLLLLCSCGTYTGSGAYVGGSFGSILGSAIGGLAGGPRGSDIGTIIGMAGGAVVGGTIGSQADLQQQNRRDRIDQQQHQSRIYAPSQNSRVDDVNEGSGFDSSNSGDDRLYDFNGNDYTDNYSAQQPIFRIPNSSIEGLGSSSYTYSPNLEIVHARFVDANQDNRLNRNETCKVIFEVMNRGTQTVYNVVPTVVETTGNKHIFISPNIHVERIDPGKGVRYTAMVKADSRLKDGIAQFCVSVVYGDKVVSKINEFRIPTTKF